MALEIERRFLVVQSKLPQLRKGRLIRQAYFSEKEPGLRVRLVENKAFLTLKFNLTRVSRKEFEYPIPFREGFEIFSFSKNTVEKIRHTLTFGKVKWTIDVFQEKNSPLILAEIELKKEDQYFEKPLWLEKEVTNEPSFTSQSLAFNPYKNWSGI